MKISNELIETLRDAESVAVLTGAGVSAESGIPTFRDAMSGLWARHDPMRLATPEAFERDPELVSEWYDHRRELCAACEPNAGHLALARLQREMEDRGRRFTLITQNVDRLHHRAGSRGVAELHGTIWLWRCMDCDDEREEPDPPFPQHPPRCHCGGPRRPGVVWFGEMLPMEAMQRAEQAASECDLFFSIGTSAAVYPAAGLIDLAHSRGAATAEINAEPTPISDSVDFSLIAPSGQALPELVHQAFGPG